MGFSDYDFMTLDEFKEKYIDKEYLEEKGISETDENHIKKDDKIVRDLTNVSYRILNFILFSHLLFGKLFTEDDKTFDEGDFDDDAYYAALGTRPPVNMEELDETYQKVIELFSVCTNEDPKDRPSAARIVEALEVDVL